MILVTNFLRSLGTNVLKLLVCQFNEYNLPPEGSYSMIETHVEVISLVVFQIVRINDIIFYMILLVLFW